MTQSVELAEIVQEFFEKNIIRISTNPLFKLTSGKDSPIYLDHRKIFSYPHLRKKVVAKWADVLNDQFASQIDYENLVFAGVATAGIAPAYALAEAFRAGFIYVRGKPKEYGLKSNIEGSCPTNAKIIVVDDMVTTGGSILQAIESLRAENFTILGATSISRHNFKKTNAAFQTVTLASLFKTTDLFNTAYAKNLISSYELRVIMEWLAAADD